MEIQLQAHVLHGSKFFNEIASTLALDTEHDRVSSSRPEALKDANRRLCVGIELTTWSVRSSDQITLFYLLVSVAFFLCCNEVVNLYPDSLQLSSPFFLVVMPIFNGSAAIGDSTIPQPSTALNTCCARVLLFSGALT